VVSSEEIIRTLEEMQKEGGTLSPLLTFYLKLLRLQSEAEQCFGIPKPGLTKEAIGKRIEQGQPLLTFAELDLDWALVRDTAERAAAVFAEHSELFGQVSESLKTGQFLTKEAARGWFEGSKLPVPLAENVSESLLGSIIHAALSPFLTSYAKALLGSIDFERWRRRYCPVCGGSPDFAFLDKANGSRWLLCPRCNAEWLFQRLACPCCGSQDQNALAYFIDDSGLYRLYVCERCKRYLKAVDLRQAKGEVLLPLERWLTLDIDAQAREWGYTPCGGQ